MDAQFQTRLRETIAWCSRWNLVSCPIEDEDIQRRRIISDQNAGIYAEAYRRLAPFEDANFLTRWKARKEISEVQRILREARASIQAADVASITPPLRSQLRSEVFRSLANGIEKSGSNVPEIVAQVAEARGRHLRTLNAYPDAKAVDFNGGRLLLYAPQDSLSDGAAEVYSYGFFDADNAPPWDAWIATVGKYVIGYVPRELLAHAQRGLEVHIEGCVLWADDPSLLADQAAASLRGVLSDAA